MTAMTYQPRNAPRVLALLATALLAGAAPLGARAAAYQVLEPDQRPLDRLSELGRQVYEADRDHWNCAARGSFIGYGRRLADVDELLQEAEFAAREAGRRLRLPDAPADATLQIFLVRDDKTWQRLAREQGFRPDSLAVQVRDEMFLRDDPALKVRVDRVSHEIIHYRLRQAFGGRIPLWADEGLAGYFGVKIAGAYRTARGRRLTGEVPALPADDLLSLDQLSSLPRLPASEAQARAYYRQAEEFFAELGWQFDDDRIAPFVHRLGDGENWRKVLEGGYGMTPDRLAELERAVRQRATTARSL